MYGNVRGTGSLSVGRVHDVLCERRHMDHDPINQFSIVGSPPNTDRPRGDAWLGEDLRSLQVSKGVSDELTELLHWLD